MCRRAGLIATCLSRAEILKQGPFVPKRRLPKIDHRRAIRQPRFLVRLRSLAPFAWDVTYGNKGSTYNVIVVERRVEAIACESPPARARSWDNCDDQLADGLQEGATVITVLKYEESR